MTEPLSAEHRRPVDSDAPTTATAAPMLPPRVPSRGSTLGRLIGRAGLSLGGWKIERDFPDLAKFVIIVAPHTSNWDFVVGILAYLALDLDATWFGKHTLFRRPFGAIFRHFGGIPIRRETVAASNVVELYVAELEKRERMVLAIAPEGTRKKVTEWKTGFYRIAHRAGVPILPVALDFPRKRIVIGTPFVPSGDLDADLPRLKAFYHAGQALYPGRF